jgi:hypothetical protein
VLLFYLFVIGFAFFGMVAVSIGIEEVWVEVDGLLFGGGSIYFLGDGIACSAVEERGVSDVSDVDYFVGTVCYIRHLIKLKYHQNTSRIIIAKIIHLRSRIRKHC